MTLLPWLVVTLLTALNALYVAAEFAAVAVQKGQIALLARGGNQRAGRLLSTLEDGAQLDRYIAACQIGITLSSVVAGAYGQATIARELVPWLEHTTGLDGPSAETAAFTLVLLSLTVLQVVLGELVPKSLALQFPERVALATYLPLRWSVSVFRGFIWLLNGSGFLLLRPFGITPGGHQHVHSPEELAVLFAASRRAGTLNPEAYRRLERGLRLSERTVRQMMTPRSELHAIEVSTPPAELLERILRSPYSRLPVYRDSLDNILGAISAKAVVGHFASSGKLPPIEQMLRPIPFVPDALRSHRFVRFLQREHSSKAVVVDEHGGVQGIVTIEDVLWELFGEIGDELQQLEGGAEVRADGTVRLPGSMRLDEAADWLPTRWDGPATTVGGHIVDTLRRMPVEGESLEIDAAVVTVTEMGPTAVRWVVVKPRPSPQDRTTVPAQPEKAS
jgi:putative hemolysin